MNILITGGSGFIGKNLIEYLSPEHTLYVPRRIDMDLLDEESVDKYLRKNPIDIVIHAAGKPGHRNVTDSTGVFYADTRMYFNLIRNYDYFGKLIITGSGGIYDMRKYLPKMKEEYWQQVIPSDEHGFFRYVTAHHIKSTKNIIDLRLFGVFGKYEDYAIRFISNAICKVLFDLPITIKQNRYFDYLYIKDLFQVINFFIHNENTYNEYNVTPDASISLLEIAQIVLKVSGKNVGIIIANEGLGREYSGDNSRLKKEMKQIIFTPLDKAVHELYHWYSDNRNSINKDLLLVDK